jgi:NAD(P)-dependent dehydrogenase (short-subunit alcohol dehydrogenase family)
VVIHGKNTAIGLYLYGEIKSEWWSNHLECDVLILCDGKSIDLKGHKMTFKTWIDSMNRNLSENAYKAMACLPYMREQKFGRIIFLSSVTPHLGVPGTAAYSAAKAGLWGLTKVIAKENADKNVLINCLNLGYMDGGMTHRIKDYEKLKDTIPVKKFGDFKEIVNAVEFLVRSDYITGTNIEINGGLW